MRRRKINLGPGYPKTRQALFFKLIIIIIVLIVMGVIIKRMGRALGNLNYFKVREIITSDSSLSEFSYLKGCNIFSLDLRKESTDISELYPNYKKVRLIRIFPDRLFIDFVKRKALAYIRLYRYFCVDDEGVIFNVPSESLKPDLPLILGLETKISGVKATKLYNIRELVVALDIIKELNSNQALKDYRVKTINVTNPTEASFFIEEGPEVKIGQDDIKSKLAILNTLLSQLHNNLGNITYIDLRFKEPVIRFKDK